MSVRTAELLATLLLAAASIGLMFKSAELRIDWVPQRGPGAGAWPFWLSSGMLVCCIATLVRWFRGTSRASADTARFIDPQSIGLIVAAVLALLVLLFATQFLGIYVALPIFLLLYLRGIGKHGWPLVLSLAITLPVGLFALFEWALQIPLPKAVTEEWFYPTYDLIYAQSMGDAIGALAAPIVGLPLIAVVIVLMYWMYRLVRRPAH